MAQASTVQAEVQRTTLRESAARQQMANPVEIRRGEVQSVTLTIPLLSERNSYLVVRLPDATVQELMRQAREVPDTERPAFVRDWIMRNQQAVIEQFVRTNRTERRFRYDVVPVPTRMGEVTPRRVEPAARVEESPHRLIETRHYYDDGRDVAPTGWRAIRGSERLPDEVRTRANVLRPPRGEGQVALGDGRVEEFAGRRYLYLGCYHPPDRNNSRRHQSISVYVPDESSRSRTISPTEVRGSSEIATPRVETREIPLQPRPQAREEDREIRGGDGSRAHPFEAYISRGRASGDGIAANDVVLPMTFPGGYQFRFNLTLSQLSNRNIQQTYQEILRIARNVIQRAEGGAVRLTSDLPAFRETVRRSLSSRPELLRYVETH